jgi:membrane-associated phospholipid phosphatase
LSRVSNEDNKPVGRWVIIGLVLLIFGAALGIAAAGDRVLPADLWLMGAVQRPGWPGFDWLAWAASRLGDVIPAYVLISLTAAVVCAWRGRSDLSLLILVAASLRALGPGLKWLFESPRPPIEMVTAVEPVDALGYPSGHALGAGLLYGALALTLPQLVCNPHLKRSIQVAAMALMILIALSRVRLGVHWPSDVVGGLAFGIGSVCLGQAALLRFQTRDEQT